MLRTPLAAAVLALCMAALSPFAYSQDPPKPEGMRPEVIRPLQAAQELIKTKNFKEALAKIQEAAAVPDRTPAESLVVERMRATTAIASGDLEMAGRSVEALLASPQLPASDRLAFIETLSGAYYNAKDYPKAIAWATRYAKEGGTSKQMRTLLAQAYYLSGDYAQSVQMLQAEMQGYRNAGETPPEDRLRLLANAQQKVSDTTGYLSTLEALVLLYPKPAYWADFISRTTKAPGFSDRLLLDVYRFMAASGNLASASDYVSLAELAIKASFPAEAQKVLDQGFSTNVLASEQHKRLRESATRQAADDRKTLAKAEKDAEAAKDGTWLTNLGLTYVSYGEFEKGIALMERGVQMPGTKRLEELKLRLGMAYVLAGQKTRGIQTLKTVQGTDGTADLARLWIVHASR